MRLTRREFISLTGSSLAFSGCLGDSDGEEHNKPEPRMPEEMSNTQFDLIEAERYGIVATVTDDHWHYQPIKVEKGGELNMIVRLDEDMILQGNSINESNITLEILDGPTDSVRLEQNGEKLIMHGENKSRITAVFNVYFNDELRYTTPVLPIEVQEK